MSTGMEEANALLERCLLPREEGLQGSGASFARAHQH